MSSDLSLNLTFGVEFEFVVAYIRSSYSIKRLPTEKHEELVHLKLRRTLSNTGLLVNIYPLKTYSRWTVDTDPSIEARPPGDGRPSGDWHGHSFVGVELKSPIIQFGPEGIKTLSHALAVLHSGFLVFVNESCGLHVHVGNLGDDPAPSKRSVGFPLQTLKVAKRGCDLPPT